ncbi:MAG: peptidase Ste24p [Bryobacterales bacterium]|nr:peptidase Ste24p [Bryobacterales bacterium]
MKHLSVATAAALALATISSAQFGNVMNKAKQKLDEAQQKAKPVTDRAQKAAETFQPWTVKEEQEIGAAGAAKMVAVFGLVEDPAITKYVNLVGNTVAQTASRQLPWRFGVLDSEIVGAYALPGGYIFITRAALSGMTDESQLAGALGHEIIHSAERHLEREIRGKKTSAWAMEEGKSVGRNSDLASLKADAFVKDLFNTSLSREKEDDADEKGVLMAAKAGYDPNGLVHVLTSMRDASLKPENKKMFGQMLSTHPSFDSRLARLQPVAAKAGGGETLQPRFAAAIAAR